MNPYKLTFFIVLLVTLSISMFAIPAKLHDWFGVGFNPNVLCCGSVIFFLLAGFTLLIAKIKSGDGLF